MLMARLMALTATALCWAQLVFAALPTYDVPAEDPLMRHIPNYHVKMLRDQPRNDAFYEGLKDAIVPNVSHVLDLGAGNCIDITFVHVVMDSVSAQGRAFCP